MRVGCGVSAINGRGVGSRARSGARPLRLRAGPAGVRARDPEEVAPVGGAEPRD